MNKSKNIKTTDIILVLLFISTIIVGFIFVGTDTEYNLNQQIARGYISREAVFFDIDNPSYETKALEHIVCDSDGNIIEFYSTDGELEVDEDGFVPFSGENIAADNPDFVLTNDTDSKGFTAVERMLSCDSSEYFTSLHSGTLRGTYYKGNIELPPLTSGRFISSEECLDRKPVAVIGKKYADLIYSENGKQFFDYKNQKYEVVGITGLSGSSPLDTMIFVNLGSLNPNEQLNGIYYIDSSTDNMAIYENFCNHAQELFGCNLEQRDIPTAQIDTVSGGMYLKQYLKLIMIGLLLFTFINILVQNLRTQRSKISVMKVLGVSNIKILLKILFKNLMEILIGIAGGLLIVLLLIVIEYFSLPVNYLITLSLKLTGISLLMLSVWIAASAIVVFYNNPREVIQRI